MRPARAPGLPSPGTCACRPNRLPTEPHCSSGQRAAPSLPGLANRPAAWAAPPWTTVEGLNRWDRVTELAFDSWEAGQAGTVAHVPNYTPAPYGPRGFESETIFIGDIPDKDFLGKSPAPGALSPAASARLVRWMFLLRYPESISKADGESWYLGTHTQEAKLMHGLERYVSWAAEQRPEGVSGPRPGKWDRLTELAFTDMDAWQTGAITRMPRWTPPPYGNPGFLSETVFIREHPEYDILSEVPKLP